MISEVNYWPDEANSLGWTHPPDGWMCNRFFKVSCCSFQMIYVVANQCLALTHNYLSDQHLHRYPREHRYLENLILGTNCFQHGFPFKRKVKTGLCNENLRFCLRLTHHWCGRCRRCNRAKSRVLADVLCFLSISNIFALCSTFNPSTFTESKLDIELSTIQFWSSL